MIQVFAVSTNQDSNSQDGLAIDGALDSLVARIIHQERQIEVISSSSETELLDAVDKQCQSKFLGYRNLCCISQSITAPKARHCPQPSLDFR